MPKKILSDHILRFVSEFWIRLIAKLGTKIGLFSLNYQQTDGQSERFHRSLEQILWCVVAPSWENSDNVLA